MALTSGGFQSAWGHLWRPPRQQAGLSSSHTWWLPDLVASRGL